MRIIAGTWRGRTLAAPDGLSTRPTSQRMRQAIFDIVMHAPWGGLALLEGASVLDAFAGTGALGLEALSRGAAQATFLENDMAALTSLRANIVSCKAGDQAAVIAGDAKRPPLGRSCALVFLDPPYGLGLVPKAVIGLRAAGWIIPGTVVVSETGRLETGWQNGVMLAHRLHGAAQLTVWREEG
jgi:16S rRNA (guanine966-N2)-methyltransferase